MTHTDPVERDLDDLVRRLPASLRDEWAVIPRRVLLQIAIVCMVLGAAIALTITGFVLENPTLRWSWPVGLVTLMLAAKFVPWWRGDRFEEQLRELRDEREDRA